MYDAIIVGARCGGAATAMLLARRGHKILLVDRAGFPSDIPQGHFVHRHGPRCLARWGLLERVVASHCPAVDSMVSDWGDRALRSSDLAVDGVAFGYGPRRRVLDSILIEAAAESGVEVRQRFPVEGYLSQNERITGIRGRDATTGAVITERATVTVGADGRNSSLARTVRTPTYDFTPTLALYYFSYWSGLPGVRLEIYRRAGSTLFVFPTNDGLHAIFAYWPIARLGEVRANVDRALNAALTQVPDLETRVHAGRREERWYGCADLPNFYRKPYGAGWALVGDAGYHKDPYLALGVSDAFRDAELLAEALSDGLSGRTPMQASLGQYEVRRNGASKEEYQLNLHLAANKPLPDDMVQLRAAIDGNPEATRNFFLANQGMIPRESFFNPANMQALMGDAQGARRIT
jgi:2-polyprenyl-6-methoxyphenol hydroxylase-like FAD-dependent oxidoreductase